jgi:hypothetical protein
MQKGALVKHTRKRMQKRVKREERGYVMKRVAAMLVALLMLVIEIFGFENAYASSTDVGENVLSEEYRMELISTDDKKISVLEVCDTMNSTATEVTVTNENDGAIINEPALFYAYEKAQNVKSEENTVDEKGQLIGTFHYELIMGNETYVYEELPNGKTSIIVAKTNEYTYEEAVTLGLISPIDSNANTNLNIARTTGTSTRATTIPISTVTSTSMGDGIGLRLKINSYTTSNYIALKIETPKTSQVSGIDNDSVYNYVYTGFANSTVSTDTGLMYCVKDTVNYGWNHTSTFGQTGRPAVNGAYVTGYNQANGFNFFLTSNSSSTRTLNLTTYRNFNGTGYVRSKVEGYAKFNNSSGTGAAGAYWLVSVIEWKPKDSVTVNSVTYWKLINAITSTNTSLNLQSWCKFKDIKLVTTIPSASYMVLERYPSVQVPVYELNASNGLTALTFPIKSH